MTTIDVDEIQPGDALLVTAHPNDPFADLIVALDGAPGRFSHAAVALGGGRMLSARPLFEGLVPLDLGGLHEDDFTYFWDRDQHIHRVAVDPAERDRAASRLGDYAECRGSFSVPKIVMVAGLLHALSPSNTIDDAARARVVRRGVDAARAWERDGDFYCAEFVATLYGWEFALADLVPPAWQGPVEVPRLAQLGVDVGARVLSAHRTDEQERTMYAFLDEVRRSDPAFFGPDPFASVRDLLDAVSDWLGEVTAPGASPGPVGETALDPATALPRGLVTPRMVRQRHRDAGDPPRVRDPRPSPASASRVTRSSDDVANP